MYVYSIPTYSDDTVDKCMYISERTANKEEVIEQISDRKLINQNSLKLNQFVVLR